MKLKKVSILLSLVFCCSINSFRVLAIAEPIPENITMIANQINVTILSREPSSLPGSGTIIGKSKNKFSNEYTYVVLTNKHIVMIDGRFEKEMTLRLSDNSEYTSYTYDLFQDEGKDLAILWFKSSRIINNVKIVSYKNAKDKEKVFSTGFPCEKQGCQEPLEIASGDIAPLTVLKGKLLKEGYQLGYTSDVKPGMSGGAILNQKGEILGVNGIGKYQTQIFTNKPAFSYTDGTPVGSERQEWFSYFSWGIPIPENIQSVINEVEIYSNKAPIFNQDSNNGSSNFSSRKDIIYLIKSFLLLLTTTLMLKSGAKFKKYVVSKLTGNSHNDTKNKLSNSPDLASQMISYFFLHNLSTIDIVGKNDLFVIKIRIGRIFRQRPNTEISSISLNPDFLIISGSSLEMTNERRAVSCKDNFFEAIIADPSKLVSIGVCNEREHFSSNDDFFIIDIGALTRWDLKKKIQSVHFNKFIKSKKIGELPITQTLFNRNQNLVIALPKRNFKYKYEIINRALYILVSQ